MLKQSADFGFWFSGSLSNKNMLPEGRGEDALGFVDTFVNRLFLYIGGKVHNVMEFTNSPVFCFFSALVDSLNSLFVSILVNES